MALFKFRKAAGDAPASTGPAPSIELIRQRAKYRLVGASVLVLLGVVGLPWLFDQQPRPIAVDLPIDIPDKSRLPPLTFPADPGAAVPQGVRVDSPQGVLAAAPPRDGVGGVAAPAASAPASPAAQPTPQEQKAPSALVEKGLNAPDLKVSPTPASAASKAQVSSVVAAGPAAAVTRPANDPRALALLEAREADLPAKSSAPTSASAAAPSAERFVVQIGAFAENERAQEIRWKVERAGMKTYTQIATTKEGKRIRVRVGPFDNKADADRVAERIRKLNLPAVLLTL